MTDPLGNSLASTRELLMDRERGHFDEILGNVLRVIGVVQGLGFDEKAAVMAGIAFAEGCQFTARSTDQSSMLMAANAVVVAIEGSIKAHAASKKEQQTAREGRP